MNNALTVWNFGFAAHFHRLSFLFIFSNIFSLCQLILTIIFSIFDSLFEAAIDRVGTDYNCEALWNKYIEFETSTAQNEGNFSRVLQIYLRILGIPLKNLEEFYNRFKVLALGRPVLELLVSDEERVALNLKEKKTELEKRQVILESREAVFKMPYCRSKSEMHLKLPSKDPISM